jgi:DNA polymerase III epsilon subunit-like protein
LVIDTETTGFKPGKDKITEIWALRFRNGKAVGRLGGLVDPEIPINDEVASLTGITNADVAGKPTIDQYKDGLMAELDRRPVIIAHNLWFDEGFLREAFGRDWTNRVRECIVLDSLDFIRLKSVGKNWTGTGKHKLANAAVRVLGDKALQDADVHCAYFDARLTGELVWALRNHLKEGDFLTKKFLRDQKEKLLKRLG